jgi:hypothetical protein
LFSDEELFNGDNMKHMIILLIICATIPAVSEEIKVSKMLPDGDMDRSFILKTNYPDTVVLDCQSFIQGLRIGEQEEAFFYMMDPQDCESMVVRVYNSLKKSQQHCIDVDQEIRNDYTCD